MKQSKNAFKAIQGTTVRRIRNIPSYFFLIWRWAMWFYALIIIIAIPHNKDINIAFVSLAVTFIETLLMTLYAPVFQILVPQSSTLHLHSKRRPPTEDEDALIFTPLAHTRDLYRDIAIYGADVLICGLVMYFTAPLVGQPPFGVGSPFYRYGLSTVMAAAFAYRSPGGLIAAVGYDLFALLGIFLASGIAPHSLTAANIVGSLIDAPIVALVIAYFAKLLARYAQSKKREQENTRRQRALVRVGETFMRGASDRQQLLEQSASQIRQGGHFQRLIIALIGNTDGRPEMNNCVVVDLPDNTEPNHSETYVNQVLQSGEKLRTFKLLTQQEATRSGIAHLYLPLFKDGQIQMVLGAESIRQTAFGEKQEEFLTIVGAQLLIALDNVQLTEQTVQLAASAERGRIAREIHDGIAQLIYMLSLNSETCAIQAHRMVEASEEDADLVTPLAERLDTLVSISKQALWETRNYMYHLRPLMSGTVTLTQMLTNQLREFEAITGLPTQFEVKGTEETPVGDTLHTSYSAHSPCTHLTARPRADEARQRTRRYAAVGPAIFRIVQEALTNAYKHAEATQLQVCLYHLQDSIKVEICDNGRGMIVTDDNLSADSDGRQHLYSGYGMRGMRERAEELKGTFEVLSQPTSGVTIRVCFPM